MTNEFVALFEQSDQSCVAEYDEFDVCDESDQSCVAEYDEILDIAGFDVCEEPPERHGIKQVYSVYSSDSSSEEEFFEIDQTEFLPSNSVAFRDERSASDEEHSSSSEEESIMGQIREINRKSQIFREYCREFLRASSE